jgi:nitrogen fixation protein FixH
MKNSAASQHNKVLAEKIRSRALKLDDRELQAKANRLAQIVEQAETEAPVSVLDLIFRKPTTAERQRGLELEEIARQLLEKHGKALA